MRTTIKYFSVVIFLVQIATLFPVVGQSQHGPIGPGKGSLEQNHILGQFAKWDRKATPMMVLRVHGAGMLQTFAEVSATGEFKLPLPEIPTGKGFGSLTCGDHSKGPIVVATDISLLTTLPGFTSPGKWDRGFSEIGMALFADEAFSKNIGKAGGKRAQWMYSEVVRTVEAGECNNTNSFPIQIGWNAYTVVSGPSGGPHTFKTGLDGDLGWYWYAFPEKETGENPSKPTQSSPSGKNTEQPASEEPEVQVEWLVGEWDGVQEDVRLKMLLQPTGALSLESIERGRRKSLIGKWSLNNGEFVLESKDGVLHFNIERISGAGFRLFGRDASSDIVFTRKP